MIFIGIDPGANKTGYAVLYKWGNELNNVCYHGECALHDLKNRLTIIEDPDIRENIVVFIEHWKTTFRRAKAHQSHVKQIKKIIRELWPRKNEVYSIEPEVWKAGMLKHLPGNTKEQSIMRAKIDGYEPKSHNEADAINILNYGIANYSMLKRAVEFTKMIIKTAKGGG